MSLNAVFLFIECVASCLLPSFQKGQDWRAKEGRSWDDFRDSRRPDGKHQLRWRHEWCHVKSGKSNMYVIMYLYLKLAWLMLCLSSALIIRVCWMELFCFPVFNMETFPPSTSNKKGNPKFWHSQNWYVVNSQNFLNTKKPGWPI